MERVQILLLVAFLFLVNIAQMADEILLMVYLLLRHQYLRNQVALFTVTGQVARKSSRPKSSSPEPE